MSSSEFGHDWRINVIGTSCAGKTTLARSLAARINAPHVELDALHWEPGWQEAGDDVFRARVHAATSGDAWVVDGNYRAVRDILWQRVNLIVWLDYSFPRVFWQALVRTWRRIVHRQPCCNGNTESFWRTFSADSILWWVVTTHIQRRREFNQLLPEMKQRGIQVVILRSPILAHRWIKTLA